MKYQSIIENVFNKFNLKPRLKQILIINSILTLYIDNENTNVILSASTGAGKSIIAVIVTLCMYQLLNNNSYSDSKCIILMNNNTLVNQYHKTFLSYELFLNVKGKSNYSCLLLNLTALMCIRNKIKQFTGTSVHLCSRCQYFLILKKIKYSPYIITNYNYFFVAKLQKLNFKNTMMTVYDLCHLLNNIYCGFMKISITPKTLLKLLTICQSYILNKGIKYKLMLTIQQLLSILLNILTSNKYIEFLTLLLNVYDTMVKVILVLLQDLYESGNTYGYKKSIRIVNALKNNRIRLFITYQYEHVVLYKLNGILILPIFLNSLYGTILNSKYKLFMSATINKDYIVKTLGVDESLTAFIKTDSFFDKESKLLLFINHDSYNYNNMTNTTHLGLMNKIISTLIDQHKGSNGIVLTPSFDITNSVSLHLMFYNTSHKIYTQTPLIGLNDILLQFKSCKKPSILISPSLFLGVDLIGDLSEFQIMVKAPYSPLTNKRIKYILLKYPLIYRQLTVFKIIQGFGRSTRCSLDSSVTYCLDSNIYKLYMSSDNIWKNLFKDTVY